MPAVNSAQAQPEKGYAPSRGTVICYFKTKRNTSLFQEKTEMFNSN
jgi:hypothetical protein